MCSLEDIQTEIHDFRAEVSSWRQNTNNQLDDLDTRVTDIENSYLTRVDLKRAIEAALKQPLSEIKSTLNEIKEIAERNRADLEPWNRREQKWSLTTHVAQVIGETATKALEHIGKAAIGVTALYGLYEFAQSMGWF